MTSALFLLTSIFQPFVGALCYLGTIKRKCPSKTDCIIWALILSLLGIYWYPWGDNQTHFAIYYTDMLARYDNISITSSYFLYDYVITKIANLAGNYVWGYFFWIFTSLSLFFTTTWFNSASNTLPNTKDCHLLFLLLIFIVGVRELLDLNRNTTALLFMISGANLWNSHKLYAILLWILSSLIHSSIIPVLIIGLLIKYLIKEQSKSFFTKFIIASAITSIAILIMPTIISHFLPERSVDGYIHGQWGRGTGVNSGFAYTVTMVNNAIFIINGFFIIKNISIIKKDILFSFYLVSLGFGIACWFLWIFRERYTMCNMVLGIVVIISNWHTIYISNNAYRSFIRCMRCLILLCFLRLLLILGQTYSANFVHHTGAKEPVRATIIVANGFIYQCHYYSMLINLDLMTRNIYLIINGLTIVFKIFNSLCDIFH